MIPEWPLLASLLGGLLILGLSGDLLIRGAASLSDRWGLSTLWTGIFIIGVGTSIPEVVLSFQSVLKDAPGLATGNIIGSNIANIMLVLALPAILFPIQAGGQGQRFALFFMVLATAGAVYALFQGQLVPAVAAICVIGLLAYVILTAMVLAPSDEEIAEETDHTSSTFRLIVFVLIGMVGLPLGAHFAVYGGAGIARELGVQEEMIGLTLLALGSSLPELTAGLFAAFKRQTDMLVGNVLGSNTFNILAAGGIISFFGPIDIAGSFLNYDVWIMIGSALFLSLIILFRGKIGRIGGLALLVLYSTYIAGLVSGWDLVGAAQEVIGG